MRFLDITILIVEVVLTIALFLAFYRLVRGPSLPDRVVALDVIAALTVSFVTVYAIDSQQAVYLDAAIVFALITFLGTAAFARYIERQARSE